MPVTSEGAIATTSTTATAPTSAELANYTLDDQISWLVGVLDAGEFDATEATDRFHPTFLAQVPVAALNAPLASLSPPNTGPWKIVDETRDGRTAEFTVQAPEGERLRLSLALAEAEPHQIEGLFLQPGEAPLPAGYTLEQLDSEMTAFASGSALGLYDVSSGACDAVHELNGDLPLAIGSIFKLWVLAELANQVDQGTAAWDESLAVQAALRSDPAGEVFQLADGDELTLREFAELMISISDNTATDHLIDRLGRDEVEAAMVRAGVADPSRNQPLIATRESFWLKFLADAPNPGDWYAADTGGRRSILDGLAGVTVPWVLDPTLVSTANSEGIPQDQPRNLDIEWLASPQDLCRTMVHLDALASTPGLEPVAEILSINPGVELDESVWTHIRYKGGSEPGVVRLSWWLERNDGRRFVVAGLLNDPDTAFDQVEAIDLVNNAIQLI